MSKEADAGGDAITRDATFLELSEPLRAVWIAVYAAGVQGELSRYRADGETSEPNSATLGDWAASHACEAVRRANGGEVPQAVIATRAVPS